MLLLRDVQCGPSRGLHARRVLVCQINFVGCVTGHAELACEYAHVCGVRKLVLSPCRRESLTSMLATVPLLKSSSRVVGASSLLHADSQRNTLTIYDLRSVESTR